MKDYFGLEKPDFRFYVPIDDKLIEKAANKTEKTGRYDKMQIEGIASSNDEDSDEEILEPKGFDLSRFLKIGYINWDHQLKTDPTALLGEPIEAKIVNNKFYVKAKLYKDSPKARDLWDTMIMLKNSGSTRSMGFSIEGKALERSDSNPKHVTKALITGLAVTPSPKCESTYADIVKGNFSKINREIKKSFTESNGGKITYLVDIIDHEKGLRYTIDTDLKLKVEKAINTTDAKVLIPESLEGKKKKAILNVVNAVSKGIFDKSILNSVFKK